MKKFLQNLTAIKLEESFTNQKNRCLTWIGVHPELFCLSLLAIACVVFLFIGLGAYPLLDVDETRYAVMARDMIKANNLNNLMLNTVPFLEKPPLYFWFVAASIKFFGGFNSFIVRFPVALFSSFLIFSTYLFGKKVISRKFGMISALVLLSSAFFLIFAHIAIIDMFLTVFMTTAIYCGFLTHITQSERYRKYYWWYFYTFVGVGFLAKGLLALAIPITIMFVYNFLTKTLKDMFKPINILPGIVIFFAIIVPWHMIMYREYGYQFVREYFLIHHFARFINSEYIGRERPFYYFIPVFLGGFLPWTLIFLAGLFSGCKKLVAKFQAAQGKLIEKLCSLFVVNNNEQKLILFSSIYFIIVFLVFSSSSTKLPTYILPVFPAAALLTGYFWWVSDEKGINEKAISVSTQIIATVLIIAAMVSSMVYYFLPFEIQSSLESFKHITIITLYLISILLLLRINTKRAMSVFFGYIVMMIFIISLTVFNIFNVVYAGGENEIVDYSKISADSCNSAQLVTFDFAVKPSVLVNYPNRVDFVTDPDFDQLDKILQYKDAPTFVIVKNKNLDNDIDYSKKIQKRLKLLEEGRRYSLYVKDVKNQFIGKTCDKCNSIDDFK